MREPSWYVRETLADVLVQIERCVQLRGPCPRQPSFSEASLNELEARTGRLPEDLREFLAWYDHRFWSRFVNPNQVKLSQAMNALARNGERIVEGHPEDRIFDLYGVFDELSSIEMQRLGDSDDWQIRTFFEDFEIYGRSPRWRDSTAIVFGTSEFGEPICYLVDPPDLPRGAIVTFGEDTSDRVWLADSLAQWLRRLVACDGMEYVFAPGDVRNLARPIRRAFIREFRARNPTSSYFAPWWMRWQSEWMQEQTWRLRRVLADWRRKPD